MYKLILAMILFLFSELTYSQIDVGNGGNVVECKSAQRGSVNISLLDFVESRVRYSLNVESNSELSINQYLQSFIQTIEKVSHSKAKIYQKWLDQFLNEAQWLENSQINPSNDAIYPFVPNQCRVVQVVLQKKPYFPNEARYYIDHQVWKKLDIMTRAALMTHEVILRDLMESTNDIAPVVSVSTKTRYLNSLIWSGKILAFEKAKLVSLLTEMIGFHEIEISGIQVQRFNSQHFFNQIKNDQQFEAIIKKDTLQSIDLAGDQFEFANGGIAKFDQNYNLKSLLIYGPVRHRNKQHDWVSSPVHQFVEVNTDNQVLKISDQNLPFNDFSIFQGKQIDFWSFDKDKTEVNYLNDKYVCGADNCISIESESERGVLKIDVTLKPHTRYKISIGIRGTKTVDTLYFKVIDSLTAEKIIKNKYKNGFPNIDGGFGVFRNYSDHFVTTEGSHYAIVFDVRGGMKKKMLLVHSIKLEEDQDGSF